MKHVKLYEQFDFEDLSDDELFGKQEKDLTIAICSGDYYIVYAFTNEIHIFNEYLTNDDEPGYPMRIFHFAEYVPRDTQTICYRKGGNTARCLWKDLSEEIKERIQI